MLNSKTKPKKMLQKHTSQNINMKGIKTHIRVLQDDKVILEEDGHSIVGNFINFLYAHMAQKDSATPVWMCSTAWTYNTISDNSGYLKLLGSVTAPPSCKKIYIVTSTNAGLVYLSGNITSAASSYIITDIPWVAGWSNDTTGTAVVLGNVSAYMVGDLNSARTPILEIGSGNTAVNIDDYAISFLNYSGSATTVSVVTSNTATDVATLTFSKTFTNVGTSSITAAELALFIYTPNNGAFASGYSPKMLIARDVFSSPIPIAAGTSITIQYVISVEITTGTAPANQSGFIVSFLQMLSNTLQGGTQPITYIKSDNTSATRTPSFSSSNNYGIFNIAGKGRKMTSTANVDSYGWKLGIICGTATEQTLDIQNYTLGTAIEDGEDTSQLRYWGSWIDDVSTGSGYREVSIHRLVENVSGSAIVVGEIALYASAGYVSDYRNAEYPSLMAATVFSAAERVTIPDNYYCEFVYTIRVAV